MINTISCVAIATLSFMLGYAIGWFNCNARTKLKSGTPKADDKYREVSVRLDLNQLRTKYPDRFIVIDDNDE